MPLLLYSAHILGYWFRLRDWSVSQGEPVRDSYTPSIALKLAQVSDNLEEDISEKFLSINLFGKTPFHSILVMKYLSPQARYLRAIIP